MPAQVTVLTSSGIRTSTGPEGASAVSPAPPRVSVMRASLSSSDRMGTTASKATPGWIANVRRPSTVGV